MSDRIEKFEDLEAWKLSRIQFVDVMRVTRDKALDFDFDFRRQMRSCALSVMNNIAEGFERRAILEKRKFYDYACGSNGEVRSMTYAGEDVFPHLASAFQIIRERSIHIGRLVTGLIRSTEDRRK